MLKKTYLKKWIPRKNYAVIAATLIFAFATLVLSVGLIRFFNDRQTGSAGVMGDFPTGPVSALNISMDSFGNCLPNAYLYPELTQSYHTSVLAFVHNPKSAGASIRHCIEWLYRALHKDRPVFFTGFTVAEEKERLLNHVVQANDYYVGRTALGICDAIEDRPCSYFTVVREPFERIVSEFYFCTTGVPGPGLPCNKSLEEFALAVGSLLFYELSYLVPCREDVHNTTYPWKCDRLQYNVHHPEHRAALLNFYLENMDKIFAVIGLTEEFDTSLKLFENAFGEPFHKICNKMHMNEGTYMGWNDTDETQIDRKRVIAEAKKSLMKSEKVRRRLHEDIQLYNKMYEIFQKQKMSPKYNFRH